MSDEDLKKILFTLYMARNARAYDDVVWDAAQECINLIEHRLGIDLSEEMGPKTISSDHVEYKE